MKQPFLFILTAMLSIHIAFCQPMIKVLDSEDSLTLIKQVAHYLDHLDVRENVHLSVHFSTQMPEQLKGMTFCLNAPASNTYQIMRVWIDARLDKTQQSLALAHEMIHVKQYAKGELIVMNKDQVMWKGRKYWYHQADNQLTPWEHEAYRTDNLLAKLWKELPEIPLTALQAHP